jgi:outer membrane autotransporter protein
VIGGEDLTAEDGRVRTIYLGLGAELAFNVGRNLDFPNLEIVGPGASNVRSLDPRFEVTWKNRFPDVVLNAGEGIDLSTWSSRGKVRIGRGFFTLAHAAVTVPNAIEVTGSLGISTGADAFLTLAGVISGSGSLHKDGAGVLSLSGSNAWAGGISVTEGTLVALRTHALGTGSVTLTEAAQLVVEISQGGTLRNAIRGGGSVVKSGSAEVVFSSSQSDYSGGTTVREGTLRVGNERALGTGSVHVLAPAALFLGTGTASRLVLPNDISGPGWVGIDAGTQVWLAGRNTHGGGIVLSGGTLSVGSAGALGTGSVTLRGGVLILDSPMPVPVPLWVSGSGALALRGGASRLDAGIAGTGTLQLSGSLTGAANVFSGSVSVQGGTWSALVKSGSGALELLRTTRLTGDAVIEGGSLVLGDALGTLQGVRTLVVGSTGAPDAVLRVGTTGATLGGGQILKGSGTLSGVMKLAAGSRVAPGNSVGIQRIQGRLEFEKGSIYEAELRMLHGARESDLLQVVGAAMERDGSVTPGSLRISGGYVVPVQEISRSVRVDAKESTGSPSGDKGTGLSTGRISDFATNAFTIVSSTIGAVISGTFEGVLSGAVLRASLEYVNGGTVLAASRAPGGATLSEEVRLLVQRVPYRVLGAAGNRARIGQALDLSLSTRDPLLGSVLDVLDQSQTREQVLATLDQLNPRVFTEVFSLGLSRLQDLQKAVSDRFTLLGAAVVTQSSDGSAGGLSGRGSDWTVWSGAYGSWSSRDASGNPGEGPLSRSSQGNVTGVERQIGMLTLGFLGAVGTGQSQMPRLAASMASESWHLGMYLSSPVLERMFVDGVFFMGEAENTLNRAQTLPVSDEFGVPSLVRLSSRTRVMSHEWFAQLGVGAQVAPEGSRWKLVPSMRVAYAGVHQHKARESGAGSLGVDVKSRTNGTFLTRTGIDLSREGHLGPLPFRITSSAAWVHDFATDPRRLEVHWQGAGSVPWSTEGERRTADFFRFGASLECGLGDRRSLRLYGEQEYADRRRVLRGGVTFTVGF